LFVSGIDFNLFEKLYLIKLPLQVTSYKLQVISYKSYKSYREHFSQAVRSEVGGSGLEGGVLRFDFRLRLRPQVVRNNLMGKGRDSLKGQNN
jgi:hypothetical protein